MLCSQKNITEINPRYCYIHFTQTCYVVYIQIVLYNKMKVLCFCFHSEIIRLFLWTDCCDQVSYFENKLYIYRKCGKISWIQGISITWLFFNLQMRNIFVNISKLGTGVIAENLLCFMKIVFFSCQVEF